MCSFYGQVVEYDLFVAFIWFDKLIYIFILAIEYLENVAISNVDGNKVCVPSTDKKAYQLCFCKPS